jgi:hypothetical protein
LGATDVTAITFDSVIAGGARYVKIAGGPWVNHGTPGAGTDLLTLLDSFPSTTDLGTTTRGTLQLHQISAPMNGFDAATALGFETANWRGEDGTFRVWATDDGTPKGIGASIHWTQALDGVRTECSMDIDAMFADAGAASISAPSGAWAWSTETPLAFALPPGFSKKSSDSSGILYHSGTSTLLAVTDVAFASLDQLSKRAWGDVAADSEYDCYVAGEAARCMVKSGSKSGVFMRLYAFTRGPAFYAIGVAGAYTQQGELEGLMDQILPTIELPN